MGKVRDQSVMTFCDENQVECIEKVSHTLWDPKVILAENGGVPPFTFKAFQVSNTNL